MPYDPAMWRLDSVNYVEAHGTGTVLGDLIECALATYGHGGDACALSAVKTNIGHSRRPPGRAHQGDAGGTTRDDPAESAFRNGIQLSMPRRPGFSFHAELPVANRGGAASGGGSRRSIKGSNAHVIIEQGSELAPVSEGRRGHRGVVSGDG